MSSTLIFDRNLSAVGCLPVECSSPVQKSSRSLVLDVGEDRLVLTARPSLFQLDVFHPFLINQENSVAQYNSSTQVQNYTVHTVYTTILLIINVNLLHNLFLYFFPRSSQSICLWCLHEYTNWIPIIYFLLKKKKNVIIILNVFFYEVKFVHFNFSEQLLLSCSSSSELICVWLCFVCFIYSSLEANFVLVNRINLTV